MTTVIRGIAVAVVALIASLAPTPSAHADEQSYLAKVEHSGVALPGTPDIWLHSGNYLCTRLHAGETPEALVREHTNFWYPAQTIRILVDAAQTELCPDTLPTAGPGTG